MNFSCVLANAFLPLLRRQLAAKHVWAVDYPKTGEAPELLDEHKVKVKIEKGIIDYDATIHFEVCTSLLNVLGSRGLCCECCFRGAFVFGFGQFSTLFMNGFDDKWS